MRTAEPGPLTATLLLVSALALAAGDASTTPPLLVLGLTLLMSGAAASLVLSRIHEGSTAQLATALAIGSISLGMAAMLAGDSVLLASPLLNELQHFETGRLQIRKAANVHEAVALAGQHDISAW